MRKTYWQPRRDRRHCRSVLWRIARWAPKAASDHVYGRDGGRDRSGDGVPVPDVLRERPVVEGSAVNRRCAGVSTPRASRVASGAAAR